MIRLFSLRVALQHETIVRRKRTIMFLYSNIFGVDGVLLFHDIMSIPFCYFTLDLDRHTSRVRAGGGFHSCTPHQLGMYTKLWGVYVESRDQLIFLCMFSVWGDVGMRGDAQVSGSECVNVCVVLDSNTQFDSG